MAKEEFNIDDPQNINYFLEVMGGRDVSKSANAVAPAEPAAATVSDQSSGSKAFDQAAADNMVTDTEVAGSINQYHHHLTAPAVPARASTTAAGLFPSTPVASPQRPLEADGNAVLRMLADASLLGLGASRHAPKNADKGGRFTSPDSKYPNPPAPLSRDVSFNNTPAAHGGSQSSTPTEPFPAFEDREAAMSQPTINVTPAAEAGKDDQADNTTSEEEDREHLRHFKTWGAPAPRSGPAARVRKIILTNLPVGSDATLVQSLIYGGAIETFALSATRLSAYVTFVSADACDAFHIAHPNGLVFKNPKTRRDHTAYVNQCEEAVIVSGRLRGYIECQASRVVRATGADEDWGMRALYRLAEAKGRKVEKIVDVYQDMIRTIIFRFTNIADAVSLRGQLLKDDDWAMCNIQFMDDPAEKATGVHLEE